MKTANPLKQNQLEIAGRTFESIYDQYYLKFYKLAMDYHLVEPVEDIVADIFTKLISPCEDERQADKLGTNYLERYNGTTQVSTYLYGIAHNICRKKLKSERGRNYKNQMSIDTSPGDAEITGSTLFLDLFVTDPGTDNLEFKYSVEQIFRRLEEHPAFTKAHTFSSTGEPRTIKVIVQYLYKGYSPKEIATQLEVSPNWVYKMIKRLADDPVLEQIREAHSDILPQKQSSFSGFSRNSIGRSFQASKQEN